MEVLMDLKDLDSETTMTLLLLPPHTELQEKVTGLLEKIIPLPALTNFQTQTWVWDIKAEEGRVV